MDFTESQAKPIIAQYGVDIPLGEIAFTADEAYEAAKKIGACVIKAQVPTGKRGKAGGIKLAETADEAKNHANQILGMVIDGWPVESLLIEQQIPIAHECYMAIINDYAQKSPLLLFSPYGGMDVEEMSAKDPNAMRKLPINITQGLTREAVMAMLETCKAVVEDVADALADCMLDLYSAYRHSDAELLEINPLVITKDKRVMALDCKFTLDDSAASRHPALAEKGAKKQRTELEEKAAALGLHYIDLEGDIGILANGAGLTMTSMDMVAYYGGNPANFLEIGGEAYTKAKPALDLVLSNKNIKALLVNFCGAFARTDVMTEGVVNAWKELAPDIPIFFTIHGTGAQEAVALVKEGLGLTPFELGDDAVKAAINAANKL